MAENPKVNLALVNNIPDGNLEQGTIYMSPDVSGNFIKVAVTNSSTVTIFDGSAYATKQQVLDNEYVTSMALNDLNTRIEDLSVRMDDIDVDLLVKVTYDELKELRDSSSLVPGMKYRMTDYDTRIFKSGADSMHHRFDLILLALSEDVLSENCRAIQHEFTDDELGEYSEEEIHYFDGCDLDAWRIMYTIDNDTDRFDWVAADTDCVLIPDYFNNLRLVDSLERDASSDLPDGSSGNQENIGNYRYAYKLSTDSTDRYYFDTSTLYDEDNSYRICCQKYASSLRPISTAYVTYSTGMIIPGGDYDIQDFVSGDGSFASAMPWYTVIMNNAQSILLTRDNKYDDMFASQGYDVSSGWLAFSYTARYYIYVVWYNDNEDYSLVFVHATDNTEFAYIYKEVNAQKYTFPKSLYITYNRHNAETDEIIESGTYDYGIAYIHNTDFLCLCTDDNLDESPITSVFLGVQPLGFDVSTHKVYTQYGNNLNTCITYNPDTDVYEYTDASAYPYSEEERQSAMSKGVIYGMVDEYGNDMPYDFKNIVYQKPGGFLPTFSGDNGPDRSSKRRTLTKSGAGTSLSTGHTGNAFYTFSRIDSSFNIYDATLKPISIVPLNINGGSGGSGGVIKGGENDVK